MTELPDMPFARELFSQWCRVRGDRTQPAKQPFGRNWDELLEAANLVTAVEQQEALRDAKDLEQRKLLGAKRVRYRKHLIERVSIPLSAEHTWCAAFGFIPTPKESDSEVIRNHPWTNRLVFLKTSRPQIPFNDLRRLNDYLMKAGPECPIVPIKERSLEIFGDEKRLDTLQGSSLFQPDRLTLSDFHCEIIGEPLAWKRGPAAASESPIIVLENAATWHSYCRWNESSPLFSAVVYGCGNRFVDGVRWLPQIFDEIGGVREISYFGDLDPQGLLIPQEASNRAVASGLPAVQPHLWSYRKLLESGQCQKHTRDTAPPEDTLFDWLQDCAEPAKRIINDGMRIPQEHLGWEYLSKGT